MLNIVKIAIGYFRFKAMAVLMKSQGVELKGLELDDIGLLWKMGREREVWDRADSLL